MCHRRESRRAAVSKPLRGNRLAPVTRDRAALYRSVNDRGLAPQIRKRSDAFDRWPIDAAGRTAAADPIGANRNWKHKSGA